MHPCYGNRLIALDVDCAMKTCSLCHEEKSIDQFHRHSQAPDGHQSRCKECSYKSNLDWCVDNPDRHRQIRIRSQLKRHGLTIEQFDAILANQGGGCAICNSTTNLHVDHDHSCCSSLPACGLCVRGILCQNCNLMLGHARNTVEILGDAIVYLLDWENNQISI